MFAQSAISSFGNEGNWEISLNKLRDGGRMFNNCEQLTQTYMSIPSDFGGTLELSYMFDGCNNLSKCVIFDNSSTYSNFRINARNMFSGCEKIRYFSSASRYSSENFVEFSGFAYVQSAEYAFYNSGL